MQLKKLAVVVFSLSSLFATSAFAQEESATARQIIDKFQTDLITVMKNGKKLGYAAVSYTHLTLPTKRIV